jgi:hypothetical protein
MVDNDTAPGGTVFPKAMLRRISLFLNIIIYIIIIMIIFWNVMPALCPR